MKKAILFDLDGTLLPVNLEEFTRAYFKLLAKRLIPLGYEPQHLIRTMWRGVDAMQRNDGTMTNEERFWKVFVAEMGEKSQNDMPVFEEFYQTDFHLAKAVCRPNPLAGEAVRAARARAEKVILATNPLFPAVAMEARLSWIGLSMTDFDLVTRYETDCYCKPNPEYFRSVLDRAGLMPEECIMIGNDEKEDMWAAAQAGIQGYLVTDDLIPCAEHPHTGQRGTFASMVNWLKQTE